MSLKLTVSNICKSYNGIPALKDCSFSFEKKGIYVIVGPNGGGKSTFFRICALLEGPDRGKVEYFSCDKTSESPMIDNTTSFNPPLVRGELKKGTLKKDINLRRKICLVLPKIGLFNTTVIKNVAYGLKVRGFNTKHIKGKAEIALEHVGLINKKNHNALTLSSGEAQRLGIARAIVLEPEVLFLDEPTASLDPHSTAIIEKTIKRIKEENKRMIIMVTHNVFQGRRLADTVLFMYEGTIIDSGPNREFFEKPGDERAYKFITGQMVY
jgi:tungstate transport system ATP-binding protein